MEKFNNGSIITRFGIEINKITSQTFNRSLTNAIINTLEIAIDDEQSIFNVYMNGEFMIFTSDLYDTSIAIGDISIKYTQTNIIIRCSFGIFIEIWLRNLNQELQFMEFTVDIDTTYKENVYGLIGNYDDDDRNDLESRNGTILSYTSSLEEIHYDFGLSWLLNDETDNNIFHSTFISNIDPLQFKPIFGFDSVDQDLLQIAKDECGQEFSCIFDVVATESIEIANTTLQFVQFAKEAAQAIKTLYNVTEIVTPSPTFEGCTIKESMNLYVLSDGNCNMTETQCINQQEYISMILQKLKSNDPVIEQSFGYIVYGNGAKRLFSILDNDDFDLMINEIENIKDCNYISLSGMINHPYYALQTAINDFNEINNDNNNIILMISGCSPRLDFDHSCTLKQELIQDNIELFVINYNGNNNNNNNNSYSCLTNDKSQQMLNIDNYDNIEIVDDFMNNICQWTDITQQPTTLQTTEIQTTINYIDETVNDDSSISNNDDTIDIKFLYIALLIMLFICLLCICGHWLYVHKLKKTIKNDNIKYGSVENIEIQETKNETDGINQTS